MATVTLCYPGRDVMSESEGSRPFHNGGAVVKALGVARCARGWHFVAKSGGKLR